MFFIIDIDDMIDVFPFDFECTSSYSHLVALL